MKHENQIMKQSCFVKIQELFHPFDMNIRFSCSTVYTVYPNLKFFILRHMSRKNLFHSKAEGFIQLPGRLIPVQYLHIIQAGFYFQRMLNHSAANSPPLHPRQNIQPGKHILIPFFVPDHGFCISDPNIVPHMA